MTPIYTDAEFSQAKSKDLLPLVCETCKKQFLKPKTLIKHVLKGFSKNKLDSCSIKCGKIVSMSKMGHGSTEVSCRNCNKLFIKQNNCIKKSPNHFCSKSCAATYNNTHKTTGTRVSKLEIYLQSELTKLYSNLEFHFNQKDTIGSELDIYIPSLNLAFEINGIFHYEPIYGKKTLSKIQNNDKRKFQSCLENNIDLYVIDSSKLSYFTAKNAQKYLNTISDTININIKKEIMADKL